MRVRDITTHSKRDTERKPRIVQFSEEQTGIEFKIHRHIDYPGTWLLSCRELCDKVNLETNDFREATEKAISFLKKLCTARIEELQNFISGMEQFEPAENKGIFFDGRI